MLGTPLVPDFGPPTVLTLDQEGALKDEGFAWYANDGARNDS